MDRTSKISAFVFLLAASAPSLVLADSPILNLNPADKIEENSFFQEMIRNQEDLAKLEKIKITYLIQSIKRSPYTFIRNGVSYSGTKAASHIFTKYSHRSDSIQSAREFIESVASRSSRTGEAYQVQFPDGTTSPVRDILLSELEKLEERLNQKKS